MAVFLIATRFCTIKKAGCDWEGADGGHKMTILALKLCTWSIACSYDLIQLNHNTHTHTIPSLKIDVGKKPSHPALSLHFLYQKLLFPPSLLSKQDNPNSKIKKNFFFFTISSCFCVVLLAFYFVYKLREVVVNF